MATKKKTERVTIRTVAEDAGVSVAAVSKVLRSAYGVSDALRAKVQASMAKLGYRPLAAARGMRGQTYTLGVLLSDISNPFFSDIMAGINAALERTEYQPLIGVSQSASSIELELIDAMQDRQMDGLILVAPRMKAADLDTVATRIPSVLIGHHLPGATLFDTVNDNDVLGANLVVKHLAGVGHRNIVFLSLQMPALDDVLITTQREIGYTTAMAECGLARYTQIVRADQTAREARTLARHLLQSRQRPEAIFCWTDFIALEVLSVATELGLSVPGDVAIVGYDNTRYCDMAQNSLTSVDQSGQLLGLQAARLLIERIKGREKAEHLVLTPRLVARSSSLKVATSVPGPAAA
ncbi:LacI family DNA-binding transcriptional regulator [Kaistia dalseonensis]|uniref:LacI family transcriptional regulator n=1 Tax=Kaistia dalseonensis TaxID=410840 RepID=A0ABU0H667_9HYPH|nr:LacI family DNA-binding transcriptional regulator [Kaistia dalseonensis]MCX5494787.1 LacI family DNA-binding transcriptional regulator [Kaistia dalseonensis]MDQ0437368.1 LacI family transcriptional regulator [Kaistia dalseonensis]